MYGAFLSQDGSEDGSTANAAAGKYHGTMDEITSTWSHDTDNHSDNDDNNDNHHSLSFPALLLFLVPERNRIPWMILNDVLAITGCLLVWDMLVAQDDRSERPFARAMDLIWEFATCFFWTMETILSAAHQRYQLHETLSWHTQLEIIIAAYFLVTTLWTLLQWHVTKRKIKGEEIWELALDTSFYVYLALRQFYQRGGDTTTTTTTTKHTLLTG